MSGRFQSLFALYVCFTIVGSLLCSHHGFAQPSLDDDNCIAIVRKAVQPVHIRRSNREEFVPLENGERIYPGDRISCSDGGFASLLFTDSAVEIKIFSNSQLILQGQRSEDTILKRLFLSVGRLWTKVLRGDLELVTPASVASVKGTEWWTIVESSSVTRTVVLEGEVEVKNRLSGSMQAVVAGHAAVAGPGGNLDVSTTQHFEPFLEPADDKPESLEIEFENKSGQKKKLKIDFRE
jgi:hypothetical protein